MATLYALVQRASQSFSSINSKDLNLHLIRAKNNRKRLGLHTPTLRHLHSYGPEVNLLIDPPSSEEDSADEVLDTSYSSAAEQLLDSCLLHFKAAEPTLVLALANLDQDLPLRTLKKTLSQASGGVRRVVRTEVQMEGGTAHCAIVIMKSVSEGD